MVDQSLPNPAEEAEESEQKKPHNFFCCCEWENCKWSELWLINLPTTAADTFCSAPFFSTKRAIIVLNIILIFLSIRGLISSLGSLGNTYIGLTDDETKALNQVIVVALITNIISFVITIAVIFGANMYNVWLVGIGVLWSIISFCVFIWAMVVTMGSDLTSFGYTFLAVEAIFVALYIYPHVVFIHEVNTGKFVPSTIAYQRLFHRLLIFHDNISSSIVNPHRCHYKRDVWASLLLLCLKWSRSFQFHLA